MKQTILTIAFLMLSLFSFSQDCSEITKELDKFDNTETSRWDNIGARDDVDINLISIKSKNTIENYLSISIYDDYLAGYSNKGLTILFKSGKKLNKTLQEVDCNISESKWKYSVFFKLSKYEILLLKTEEISDVKLYIFEREIKYSGENIKKYADCLFNNKIEIKPNKLPTITINRTRDSMSTIPYIYLKIKL